MLLGLWLSIAKIVLPIIKSIHNLFTEPHLQHKKNKIILITSISFAILFATIFIIPIPVYTVSEGMIWLPESSLVRSETNGFITKIISKPNTMVNKNQTLIMLSNIEIDSKVKLLKENLIELKNKYYKEIQNDRLASNITKQEMQALQAELDLAIKRLNHLKITSSEQGTFILPNATDLIAQYVSRGQILGYISNNKALVRASVSQSDISLLRKHIQSIEMRTSNKLNKSILVKINKITPKASNNLPHALFSIEGGGKLNIDPQTNKTLEKIFLVEIKLPDNFKTIFIGQRTFLRFNHGKASLAKQFYRSIRQLLLRRLNV